MTGCRRATIVSVARMYPARVTCQGCPGDPYAASKADWHLGKPEEVGQRVFDPAAIERPAPGSAIDDWVRVFKRKRDEIVKARCE